MAIARFDDLRPRRRRSFALAEPVAVLTAHTSGDVPGVLAGAEAAVGQGRWVAGFVTYEAAPAFDAALRVRDPAGGPLAGLPLAWFGVFGGRRPASEGPVAGYRLGGWQPVVDRETYTAAIRAIREHIRQGDTYQVNHTFRMRTTFEGDPEGLYRDLSRAQSCGYGAYLDTGRWVVASASPELFFEWRHGKLVSRPMKGTTRRGLDLAGDEYQRHRLEQSEKDRAENVMIVDMVRNDLGRIARPGTVEVPELFTTEKYDTVWQLTSTVAARPRPEVGLLDVFAALFPCASITGAPKVATMAIIERLEADPRGVYCGAVGFGGPGPGGEPEWAFNVGIRTVLIDRVTGTALYGTGGGITYDSTAEGEYEEALLKARVLDRRSADFELLETIRWDPAAGFRHLAAHLRRLSDSAWYFDVPLDPAEVRVALDRAVRATAGPARVRLLVDRSGWIRTETSPLSPRGLLRLAVDDRPVERDDPFLRHKTTNRRVYEEAAARHPEADDVVLWNEAGEVTETTIGNLAVCLEGRWWTPPVEAGLLAGVERAELLRAGLLAERTITLGDLPRASGLARVNSVRGWEGAVIASV
jgi:para-aminobenzoate synthetase/4-amino-4-deoxychorismate lyase